MGGQMDWQKDNGARIREGRAEKEKRASEWASERASEKERDGGRERREGRS